MTRHIESACDTYPQTKKKGGKMKRIRKVIASALTLMMSIFVMCVGVYAAASAPKVGISGSISYDVGACKVRVIGNLDGAYTNANGSGTTPVAKSATDDKGQACHYYGVHENAQSETNMLPAWGIGSVYFKETAGGAESFVITLKVENLSAYPIKATVNNTATEVLTNVNKTIKNNNAEIAVGASGEIQIRYDVADSSKVANLTIGNELVFEKTIIKTLKHDEENQYYYVEMGTYEGAPVRWAYYASVDDESGTATMYEYDATTAPTGKGYFIAVTDMAKDIRCCFDNSYKRTQNHSVYHTEEGLENVLAVLYGSSTVRKYLKGIDVQTSAKFESFETEDYRDSYHYEIKPSGRTSNFLKDLDINENDAVYSKITGRTLTDLYESSGHHVENSKEEASVISYEETDKLWLYYGGYRSIGFNSNIENALNFSNEMAAPTQEVVVDDEYKEKGYFDISVTYRGTDRLVWRIDYVSQSDGYYSSWDYVYSSYRRLDPYAYNAVVPCFMLDLSLVD